MKVLQKIGLVGLILALTQGLSEARTLEEILQQKGVITAEDYAEAQKSRLVSYQPGKGLVATTADGNYRLQLGGYAQLIYRYTDLDDQNKDDTSDFDIRRFKLQMQGHLINKRFGYKFQGEISDGFKTEDAYLNYSFAAPFKVQFGQFKPPQARQELISASRQLFPERSLANDTFNLGRDQGVQAMGNLAEKLVEYQFGLFNGNGPNTSNPDNRHMLAGRLDFNPLGAMKMDEAGWPTDKPLLNLGGSFAWNKVGANDVGSGFDRDNDVMDVALGLDSLDAATFNAAYGSELTWLLWTANINAAWCGASFAGEYYRLSADPDQGDDWDADGYYVQAGYQIIPNQLELALRYSEIESDDVNASAKFDKAETQLGVNYYLSGHAAKVQADYTWKSDDLADNKDDRVARLQLQFYY